MASADVAPVDAVAPVPGIARGVVVAGLVGAASALPLMWGFSEPTVPTVALRGAGWPVFAVAAALLTDRPDGVRVGKAFLAVALVPVVVYGVAAMLMRDPVPVAAERVWATVGIVPVVLTVAVVAWSLGVASDRLSRRRLTWFVLWSVLVVAAASLTWQFSSQRVAALVTTGGLWLIAGIVTFLTLVSALRPIDEPLIDLAAGMASVGSGAGSGLAVAVLGTRAGIPSPELSAAFAAVSTTVFVTPAALWARRTFLERRYGRGTLTPGDVAAITADLHAQTDPRELLGKAATMVAAASGHRAVTIVLGADEPELDATWMSHPLIVAGDLVGTLAFDPLHPEGPEPRQVRIAAQLLPTLALVAKAVGLAVDATHARQDLARERDTERERILGDLHDGLGPALAGMGMRVQARLRSEPSPWLQALAAELADCRGDLRRLVSGLTPPVLHDTTLEHALAQLVASFAASGPRIELATSIGREPSTAVAVAVYRFVAEGVTNALRHAQAEQVEITIASVGQAIVAEVADDGVGGPIAPGIGLTSLRRRADDLGGHLRIEHGDPAGTQLYLELLAGEGAA